MLHSSHYQKYEAMCGTAAHHTSQPAQASLGITNPMTNDAVQHSRRAKCTPQKELHSVAEFVVQIDADRERNTYRDTIVRRDVERQRIVVRYQDALVRDVVAK
jgi:hypothetical protein